MKSASGARRRAGIGVGASDSGAGSESGIAARGKLPRKRGGESKARAPLARFAWAPEDEGRRAAAIDAALMCALLVSALGTRLFRLFSPPQVIFDEYHFARFLAEYANGEYFFDIHPPLAKLVMLFAARAVGGFPPRPREELAFLDKIGNPMPADFNFHTPRAVSALFGSACIPLLFRTARLLRLPRDVALMVAAFALFDMNLAIESRLVLTDAQLLFWCGAALCLMLELWRFPCFPPAGTRGSRALQAQRWALVAATGLACGACISIKFTGLATPGVTGLASLTGASWLLRRRVPLLECAVIGAVGVLLKLAVWAVHFALLPKSGSGDVYMSRAWALEGSTRHDPALPEPGFLAKVLELNVEMVRASARISARHAWESKWYEWPLSLRGILYFADYGDGTQTKWIYLVGNLVVYMLTAAAVAVALVTLAVVGAKLVSAHSRRKKFRASIRPAKSLSVPPVSKSESTSAGSSFGADSAATTLPVRCSALWFVLFSPWPVRAATAAELGLGKISAEVEEEAAAAAATALHERAEEFLGHIALLSSGWLVNMLPYIGISRCAFLYHYLPGLWYGELLAGVMLHGAVRSVPARRAICATLIIASACVYAFFAPWVYALPLTPPQLKAHQWLPRWD